MAEKEYIPIEEIEKHFGDILNTEYVDDYATGFKAALKAILSYSTVDVTPIRHGHIVWKERHRGGMRKTKCYYYPPNPACYAFLTCKHIATIDERYTENVPYCSECGKILGDFLNYCGNCGCKLDNESEGNNNG